MKWFERDAVVDYIIDCYAGVEQGGGHVKRRFIWEQEGDVVLGNARAFGDHLSEKFELGSSKTLWMGVHKALRSLGELAQCQGHKEKHLGRRFVNQEPEVHILR